MTLDLLTLLTVTTFTTATAGGLLLFSWLQHRDVPALAFWGCGFLLSSAATALIANEARLPEFWSVTVGHIALATAYGAIWSGVRRFNGRRTSAWATLAGAFVWIVFAQLPEHYQSPHLRAAVSAAILVSYSALAAVDFWRARKRGLMSRWPIVVLLLTHAAIVLTRIPVAGLWPAATDAEGWRSRWLAVVALETILHAFCLAYLLGTMARESIVLRYKRASETDPLTGVTNRGGFITQAERMLRRARRNRTSAALLLLDIDHFKLINDSFGHATGDRVLIELCNAITTALRPGDMFARLGGEEFACLLADTALSQARPLAERLRARVAEIAFHAERHSFSSTVSIGIAMADGDVDPVAVLARADRALYRAKANGRNRVETDTPQPCVTLLAAVDGPALVPERGAAHGTKQSTRAAPDQ